ncbi:hypothetical protein [Micromonospora maris]|uniref:hypothetical protein n=1 Tax=Micromonospora maris TaxID=1003110 RepID=UPI0005BC8E72|nr:hypothetical protein [Micromonospora maris]
MAPIPITDVPEADVRTRPFLCPTVALAVLPRRRRGTHLPEWLREPTQPLPLQRPGRPGWLTPGQQWRADGGQR